MAKIMFLIHLRDAKVSTVLLILAIPVKLSSVDSSLDAKNVTMTDLLILDLSMTNKATAKLASAILIPITT